MKFLLNYELVLMVMRVSLVCCHLFILLTVHHVLLFTGSILMVTLFSAFLTKSYIRLYSEFKESY